MLTLYFGPVSSSFFLFFLAYSQQSQIACLPYFYTWCRSSANLECRSEMCCKRLAKNAGQKKNRQKFAVWAPSHKFVGLNLRNEGTYRQSKKNLLSSNTSSTRPDNMVNFGPLTAEIGSGVWGTPGNFIGFRVLAALLHGTLVVGVSQTAALNRGRHLYSTGRPSRWALAHILVSSCFFFLSSFFFIFFLD